ncbi:hypothetical protein EKN56_07290 [Limnobaculum zhutongyuii]|uniref:Toxin VasX N-terminal region domain-containing protein n=1 Tax=Limnobaculum zhutongyuii TaxID=2498113 RepID=A0A411WJ71_9GAMM|nr:T6SS effector BTH_I2691 family protein [Limnobaculum zhutongyuii]QBH96220.1 hypothetical protein EKN56_07290 [Limnobaculum zhutongyuii]TQS86185.1 hypothetical protein ELQ32_20040 [Limnobaculum zhutongyuii]
MSQSKDFICDCQTKGLAILPVRYAVVPKTVAQKLPAWADQSWAKSKGFKAELDPEQYHYALRVVRQGFIYVYLSALEESERWRVFSIAKDGTLWKQASAKAAKLKDKSDCSTPGHQATRTEFFCISEPEKCGQIWIAYSEHKWSENTLKKYAADPGLRMKEIKASEWQVPSNKDDIAKATEESLNSVLDYCPDFDYGSFPDIDYGLPVPYSEIFNIKNSWDFIKARDKHFNITKGKKNDFSFIDNKVEIQTSNDFFIKNRKGKANETESLMMGSAVGKCNPLIIALEDPIGSCREINSAFNEVPSKLIRYTRELEYYFSAWSLIGGIKPLIENYNSIQERARAEQETNPERRKRLINRTNLRDLWKAEPVDLQHFEILDEITDYSPDATYDAQLEAHINTVNMHIKHKRANGYDKPEYVSMDRWAKYQKKLDKTGSYESFNQEYQKLQNRVKELSEKRCTELVKLIRDNLLNVILEDYDTEDLSANLVDAVEFREVVSDIVDGIGATKSGLSLIDEWLDNVSENTQKNYLRRALAFNQSDMVGEIDTIFSERNKKEDEYPNELTEDDVTTILAQVKWSKLADLYKKSQSYVNTQLRIATNASDVKGIYKPDAGLKYFSDRLLINFGFRFLFTSYGPVTKAGGVLLTNFIHIASFVSEPTSRSIVGNIFSSQFYGVKFYIDKLKGINTTVNAKNETHYANIKSAVSEIEEISAKSTPKSGVAVRNPDASIPARNAIVDVRLAFLVAILEVWNLTNVMKALDGEPNNEKLKEKVTIAILATIGASTETFAQLSKLVATESSNTFKALKIGGAVISSGAGILNACIDAKSIIINIDNNHYGMAGMYFIRAVMNFGSSGAGILTALTYSTSFMEYFIERSFSKYLITRKFGQEAISVASRVLLFRSIAMGAGIYISVIILAITIIIYLAEDDELELWMERCAFGIRKEGDYFSGNLKEQEKQFKMALSKVLNVEFEMELDPDAYLQVPPRIPPNMMDVFFGAWR